VSVYALADQMGGAQGGAAKRPGLYAITSPSPEKRPTGVSFELLSELLTSLSELTASDHSLNDVLSFSADRDWRRPGLVLHPGRDAEVPGQQETPPPRKRGRPVGSGKRKA
jgi:hypothetical protein